VVEITKPDVTDRHGVQIEGGLADPKMGPIDSKHRCGTCSRMQKECPGHFGHIELAVPCYGHPFIKSVLKILRCVCSNCSSFLLEHRIRDHDPLEDEALEATPGTGRRRQTNRGADAVRQALAISNPKARLTALSRLVTPRSTCQNVITKRVVDEDGIEHFEKHLCGAVQPTYSIAAGVIKVSEKKGKKRKATDPNASEGEEEDETANRSFPAGDALEI